MPVLRIKFLPNLNSWDEAPPDPGRIADKWFEDPEHEQPSLYEAGSQVEEVEAVAAFSLTNLAKRIEVGYLVRIEWADLAAVGIEATNDRPGSTGVVAVDFRHWEIPGHVLSGLPSLLRLSLVIRAAVRLFLTPGTDSLRPGRPEKLLLPRFSAALV
jgi:hypothetical protein